MISGCITCHGSGTLCNIEANINAVKYIEIQNNQLWSVMARHFPNHSYIFQDDNAPVHQARIMERYKHENNIHGIVWPAQSPDIKHHRKLLSQGKENFTELCRGNHKSLSAV